MSFDEDVFVVANGDRNCHESKKNINDLHVRPEREFDRHPINQVTEEASRNNEEPSYISIRF
jgi:hypothetical protein